MQAVDPRRPNAARQDTFDLRDKIHTDDQIHMQAHADATNYVSTDDEEHSVLEDDSDGEDRDVDYMESDDDDGSSSLSIPNESIDFDLVYSLHSFAATVEGQANVVKGDSLFLMDDSNSYWWLVRVLKTQEVGYIPAENIETPFERLARLNKHRNVDLASATQAEMNEDTQAARDRLRANLDSRAGSNKTPSPSPGSRAAARSRQAKGVSFIANFYVHRYPPAVWNEEEEEEEDIEWDDEGYEAEDQGLADEQMQQKRAEEGGPSFMEPDDGMRWDDSAAEGIQARQAQARAAAQAQAQAQAQAGGAPGAPRSGPSPEQQQQMLLAQQQEQIQRDLQQQQQMQLRQQQQSIAQQQQQGPHTLRPSNSRERLTDASASNGQPVKRIDPLEATETRKLTVTPTIAREEQERASPNTMQRQEEDRSKRLREEAEAEEARKRAKNKEKMAAPVSSTTLVKPAVAPAAKLRKDREPEDDGSKKKKGVFGFSFGRKNKSKEKNLSVGSTESAEMGRSSEESGRSSRAQETSMSPTTAIAMQQQQQQQQALNFRNSTDPRRAGQEKQQQQPQATQQQQPSQQQQLTPGSSPPQVSQHASQLRQRDQQQQALYQQYLNRSPSSPPEAQPSYGLQSASAVMPGPSSYHSPTSSGGSAGPMGSLAGRPRPGSLILTPSSVDGQGVGVPELNVIRVFAGKNLQTEATFKTVLLNTSTTSADLVRQAIQRFRLPAGEDENDYYLTVKQMEGSSAVLLPAEKPLGVFETLVEAAMELPKVKRSSVGSISSVASNLSMHPAIKKLPMNDFTDDSAVKFYLNRKGEEGTDTSSGNEGDDTMLAESSFNESEGHGSKQTYLTVSTPQAHNVTPERFSSPSFRFALQLIIYPDDLPDDMVFDPMTEAIVFKDTLRDRSHSASSPGISQNLRRKVFVFPKNVTVAEVIELGLERFGILEGVVDGGDEVEDKLTKRRSSVRVRYGLTVDAAGGPERELSPSSKVIDAYPKPPTYRAVDRRFPDHKRRSTDSGQLLGTPDDVHPEDPIFILRRAVSYRSSTSRHRLSAPLDEIALQNLHRESVSSIGSDPVDGSKQKQPSRQEIIAAQRAATRANQRAILSAQTNSVRGVDVLLPGNAMIRSSRYDAGDRMRYSYVQPDGETYDISDIVEEEWRENNPVGKKNDLLEGVLVRNKDANGVLGEKLDRVLSKIRTGKAARDAAQSQPQPTLDSQTSLRTVSPSLYSVDDVPGAGEPGSTSRSATPNSAGLNTRTPIPPAGRALSSASRSTSPADRNTTPTAAAAGETGSRRHPSIASVMSDVSGYATPTTNQAVSSVEDNRAISSTPKSQRKRPLIPKDDFGVAHMMAIIEYGATKAKTPLPPLDPIEEMLFGRPVDMDSLHPRVKDIYTEGFKQLNDMDKMLNDFLHRVTAH